MVDNPALLVFVKANIADLKAGLAEGRTEIDATVATAIGLHTQLVLAESAAKVAGTAMRTLADNIATTGTATEAQVTALAKATSEFLAMKGAVGAAKDQLAALKQGAEATTPVVHTLHGALNQFDGILAAMGLHLGPEIRGLGELGAAAGKTSGDLGLIATGGLAVGAAMGGWKIGRAISEFFDLDAIIGSATARLLGWGDAAGEAAGAKADVLARASASVGYAITDLTIAMGINGESHVKWQSNATISAEAVKGWHAEIAKVTAGGELESLTKDLESQNFTVKDLAARYHVSVEALQLFGRETAKAAAAEKAASESIQASNKLKLEHLKDEIDATKAWRDAMGELNSSGDGWKGTLDTIDGTVVEAIKSYLAAGVSQHALAEAYGLTDVQVKSVSSALKAEAEEQKAATDERERNTAATAAAIAAEEKLVTAKEASRKKSEDLALAEAKRHAAMMAQGGSTEYDLSTEAGRGKVPEDIATWLHVGYSLEQAARLAYALKMGFDISRDPLFAHKGPAVPGFAGGVENAPGGWAMVGERGPEAMYVPPGSTIKSHGTPIGGGSSDGGPRIIQLVVDGRVLASVLDNATMKRQRDIGERF